MNDSPKLTPENWQEIKDLVPGTLARIVISGHDGGLRKTEAFIVYRDNGCISFIATDRPGTFVVCLERIITSEILTKQYQPQLKIIELVEENHEN